MHPILRGCNVGWLDHGISPVLHALKKNQRLVLIDLGTGATQKLEIEIADARVIRVAGKNISTYSDGRGPDIFQLIDVDTGILTLLHPDDIWFVVADEYYFYKPDSRENTVRWLLQALK